MGWEMALETRERGHGVVWQDAEELRVWKVEYYDRKDSHLKTLAMAAYEQHPDRYWQTSELTMFNPVTGKSTVLNRSDFEYGTPIDDAGFTQTGLRRVR